MAGDSAWNSAIQHGLSIIADLQRWAKYFYRLRGDCRVESSSYACCIRLPPVDLGTTLRRATAQNPRKPALVCGDQAISYESLNRSTDALAGWLLGQGLEPGDRVAIHLAERGRDCEFAMCVRSLGDSVAGRQLMSMRVFRNCSLIRFR